MTILFRPFPLPVLALLLLAAAACSPQPGPTLATKEPLPLLTESPTAAASPSDPASPQPSPTRFVTPQPDAWQSAPVVPEGLSQRARDIVTRGQALGRNPRTFSKVGDCGGTPSWFLGPFDLGDYELGDYSGLQDVIDFYAGSYNRDSLAVHNGFNAASILASIRANREFCETGEHP